MHGTELSGRESHLLLCFSGPGKRRSFSTVLSIFKFPEAIVEMCSNVNPYLFSRDCTAHIEWLKKVFDVEIGTVHYFKEEPNRVMHTCVSFQDGGGKVMMSDYMPGEKEKCSSNRGFAVSLGFKEGQGRKYWNKAIENGGQVEMQFDVQFWGSYFGSFVDPFGFLWFVVEQMQDSNLDAKSNANSDQ